MSASVAIRRPIARGGFVVPSVAGNRSAGWSVEPLRLVGAISKRPVLAGFEKEDQAERSKVGGVKMRLQVEANPDQVLSPVMGWWTFGVGPSVTGEPCVMLRKESKR